LAFDRRISALWSSQRGAAESLGLDRTTHRIFSRLQRSLSAADDADVAWHDAYPRSNARLLPRTAFAAWGRSSRRSRVAMGRTLVPGNSTGRPAAQTPTDAQAA